MFDYSADTKVRAVISRAHKDRAHYVAGLFARMFGRATAGRAARA
ncbi:hypothetical protein P6F26_11210 [Roseibacterium sp. SDUM158017]|nr:hypothetical protein [Roseibacterium sp. SDUM158017]MDG4649013.1 hypothetical protein [Roseibacterium sp. SDUM158017]